MGRRARSYLPGAAFHLTARTCREEGWFDEPLRDEIVAVIGRSMLRTDAQLFAFSVMDNHFHLVIRQRIAPLGQLMHSICRRTALAVRRRTGREGYVFERRYRDLLCHEPRHLRRAIVYTHINPCRAGLCADPGAYRWSSHYVYSGLDAPTFPDGTDLPSVTPCLELYGTEAHGNQDLYHRDYARYIEWRLERDRLPENAARPPEPTLAHGDAYWLKNFGSPVVASAKAAPLRESDLRDLVLSTLKELDPDLDLDVLRRRKRGRAAEIRRVVIARALEAGFRGVQIARMLAVDESTISKVATTLESRPYVRFDTRQGYARNGH